MLGAFRPSAPLSGGLLWKIPWRISAPRKLRQRRRLRRVDNVVSVLDTALKREATTSTHTPLSSSIPSELPNSPITQRHTNSKASPSDLATTAEGQRLLSSETQPSDLSSRRHGRGPNLGEYATATDVNGVQKHTSTLLSTEASAKGTLAAIERWKAEMPTEGEMLPRDKYTMFDKKVKKYRKGVHKLPKWTRVSQRLNPPGF